MFLPFPTNPGLEAIIVTLFWLIGSGIFCVFLYFYLVIWGQVKKLNHLPNFLEEQDKKTLIKLSILFTVLYWLAFLVFILLDLQINIAAAITLLIPIAYLSFAFKYARNSFSIFRTNIREGMANGVITQTNKNNLIIFVSIVVIILLLIWSPRF